MGSGDRARTGGRLASSAPLVSRTRLQSSLALALLVLFLVMRPCCVNAQDLSGILFSPVLGMRSVCPPRLGVEDSLSPGVLWLSCRTRGVVRVDVAGNTVDMIDPDAHLTADSVAGGPLLLLQQNTGSSSNALLWRASIDQSFEAVLQLPADCPASAIQSYGDSIYIRCQSPNRLLRFDPRTRDVTGELRAPTQGTGVPLFSIDATRGEMLLTTWRGESEVYRVDLRNSRAPLSATLLLPASLLVGPCGPDPTSPFSVTRDSATGLIFALGSGGVCMLSATGPPPRGRLISLQVASGAIPRSGWLVLQGHTLLFESHETFGSGRIRLLAVQLPQGRKVSLHSVNQMEQLYFIQPGSSNSRALYTISIPKGRIRCRLRLTPLVSDCQMPESTSSSHNPVSIAA